MCLFSFAMLATLLVDASLVRTAGGPRNHRSRSCQVAGAEFVLVDLLTARAISHRSAAA
jgi:hypothetical protein